MHDFKYTTFVTFFGAFEFFKNLAPMVCVMQEGLLEGMRYPKGPSPVFNPSTMGFFEQTNKFFSLDSVPLG